MKKFVSELAILFVTLTVVTSTTSALDVEREALLALYDSTQGESWGSCTWDITNQDHCSWCGVTCDAGHVTRLVLTNNQLIGFIPNVLDNLSWLEYLALSSNQISGPIPPELGNLDSLEMLSLSNNQLMQSIPSQLGNLSKLSGLELDNNELNGPIPTELGDLNSLRGMILWNNHLTGTLPSELGNLNNLVALTLWPGNAGLTCWETISALNWAQGLDSYMGPSVICLEESSVIPILMVDG